MEFKKDIRYHKINDKRLIQFLADGKLELYHLKNDPIESHNLTEGQPEVADNLGSELVEWRKANKVPLPLSSVLEF